MEVKRYGAFLIFFMCGCASRPRILTNAPEPGRIGSPRFTTDDNSTGERVTFSTKTPATEVRGAFDAYCRGLGFARDRRSGTSNIVWWHSSQEELGILVSPSGQDTLLVTYFYNQ